MTYRDDLLARRERAEQIAAELREIRRRMTEIHELSDKARDLDRALDTASRDAGRARAKVALPLLGNVRVASPCKERWEDMDGDARARNYGRCEKNVFDLSAMTAQAAEDLLGQHGANLCVRFYRRPDGTVMTSDCAVGARRKRVRNLVIGAGAAAFSLAAGTVAVASIPVMGEYVADPYVMGVTVEQPYVMGEYMAEDYRVTETETETGTKTETETETETETGTETGTDTDTDTDI